MPGITKVELNSVASQAKNVIVSAVNGNGSITDEQLVTAIQSDTNLKDKFTDPAKLREACGAILTSLRVKDAEPEDVFKAIATEAQAEVDAAAKAAEEKAKRKAAEEEEKKKAAAGGAPAAETPKQGKSWIWTAAFIVVGLILGGIGTFGSEKKGLGLLSFLGGIVAICPWLKPIANWLSGKKEEQTQTANTQPPSEEAEKEKVQE